jgi:hypothetical protein
MRKEIELNALNYEAIESRDERRLLTARSAVEITDATDHLKMEYFSLGITSGASLQMLMVTFVLLFLSSYHNSGPLNQLSKEYYPLFRMIFFILWFWILYGVNLFIWKRFGLAGPFYRIYGLNPEIHTYQHILRSTASVAYIVFMCFVIYTLILSGLLGKDTMYTHWKHAFPAMALFLPLILFFIPSDSVTHLCFGMDEEGEAVQQRYGLIKEFGLVLAGPLVASSPLRSLIADILCSMPKVFIDLSYTICVYSSTNLHDGAEQCVQGTLANSSSVRYWYLTLLMSLIPYIIRTLQALREYHDKGGGMKLWNAFKYVCSVCVTLLNTVKVNTPPGPVKDEMTVAWFAVAAFTTAFSYYWDVKVGWGLLEPNSKNFLLRDDLTYPKSWYYSALVANFLMRLAWAFNISPGQPYVAQNVILLFGCLELVRRFLWLTFKVEHTVLTHK